MLATILRKLGLDVDVDEGKRSHALDALEEALSHMPPAEARASPPSPISSAASPTPITR